MRHVKALAVVAILAGILAIGCGSAQAANSTFPVVTGEHWVNASPDEKLAFIAGLTTMIELEKEVQGNTPPENQRTLIPAWVSGLSRFTLKDIVAKLDDVFKNKPELKAKPVVEVLWYEVAFPKNDK